MDSNPAQQDVNEAFYCPITGIVMTDPVIFPDGYTYERSAIEEWLKKHNNSPYTRQTMQANQGIPNRALKTQIEEMSDKIP